MDLCQWKRYIWSCYDTVRSHGRPYCTTMKNKISFAKNKYVNTKPLFSFDSFVSRKDPCCFWQLYFVESSYFVIVSDSIIPRPFLWAIDGSARKHIDGYLDYYGCQGQFRIRIKIKKLYHKLDLNNSMNLFQLQPRQTQPIPVLNRSSIEYRTWGKWYPNEKAEKWKTVKTNSFLIKQGSNW